MVKILYRLEYGIAFSLILFLYFHWGYSFWLFVLLFFVPDLAMAGDFINHQAGSILYNAGHSLTIPLILLGFAILFDSGDIFPIACIGLAHILMDRCLGFGLK